MQHMNLSRTGMLNVVLAGVGYGFVPIFALYAYQGQASVLTFIFLRALTAATLFSLYIFMRSIKVSLSITQWVYLFAVGLLETLQAFLYLSSVKYISASLTELLFCTYSILVALFSFFIYREKLSVKLAVAIILSFVGLMMVLGVSPGKVNFYGVVLAFGAAFCSAVGILIGYRIVLEVDPIISGTFISFFMALLVLPVGLYTKGIHFNIEMKA